jgi:hypothetical protein
MMDPFHTSGNSGANWMDSTTNNCQFNSNHTTVTDFAWLPSSDVMGNSVNPPLHPYQSVTLNGGKLKFDSSQSTAQKWANYHAAALNAADNAAYRARSNATVPANVFVIGLGGNGNDPTDHILLQRMANDTRGDVNGAYPPCVASPTCYHYTDQNTGTYIYSTNQTTLKQKFLELSSQILRLSQ